MTTNINNTPFLRTSRQFPFDAQKLILELNKSYIDTATAVNNRIIGIFPSNISGATGESWYLNSSSKQQTLRIIFSFTTTASINHGIKVTTIGQFVRCWGSYTDNTNCYGLIWNSTTAIAGQIGFYITPTQIVFTTGAAAPTLQSGVVILEYLSQP